MDVDVRGGLDRLFSPRSVAVIGASANRNSLPGMLFEFLRRAPYRGRIVAVNPRYKTIDGVPCAPSVTALSWCPDLAAIAVPTDHLLSVVEDCAEKGVPAAVVMTGGFGEGETGDSGVDRANELHRLVRTSGMRLLGPNTVGMVNFAEGIPITFADWYARDTGRRDAVAVVTQSGSVGGLVFSMLQRHGVGVRHWVGTGNELDVDAADAVEHLGRREDVTVVACFIEGLRDGRRFLAAAARAHECGTRVVVLKAGRSVAGQRSSLSHTGKLSSASAVYSAAFRQAGVIETASLSELAMTVAALVRGVQPGSRDVGIVAASGGACSVIADHAEAAGLAVPPLAISVRDRLRRVVPAYGGVSNPVDLSADAVARPEILAGVLETVRAESTPPTWILFGRPLLDRYAPAVVEASRGSATLVACSGVPLEAATATTLAEGGVLAVEDPEVCCRALARVTAAPPLSEVGPAPVRRRLGSTIADPARVLRTLHDYGAPVVRSWTTATAAEAEAMACGGTLSFPVAIKTLSPRIAHRTEAGCVAIGLETPDEVAAAARRIAANARQADPNDSGAVIVQTMAPAGLELLLTVSQDADFGPVVVVGLGGVGVEATRDVATRLLPLDGAGLLSALDDLRCAAQLRGFRGAPPADLDALASLWDSVVRAYTGEPWMGELELNPVIVAAAGAGAWIVDALVTEAMA